jgi:hypothetical protein
MKLFGVTQREAVGDTLASLFPPPLSSYPQELLDKCAALADSDGQHASSLVIGLHRSGYALPLYAAVNELGGGISSCLFRRAPVTEEFLLFTMTDTFTVTAVSQETLAMMGARVCTRAMAVAPATRWTAPVLHWQFVLNHRHDHGNADRWESTTSGTRPCP